MQPESGKVLDFERIEEATGGDQEFMKELLDLYMEDAKERISELEDAARAGDSEELAKCAHKLKGSSANVGATGISMLAKTLEDKGHAGDTTGADELVRAARKQLADVGAAFESFLSSTAS